MGFGRQAALAARGDGPYGARVLVLENVSTYAAAAVTIAFTGQQGDVALLTSPVPARVAAGETIRLPLRRVRRDAAFRVTVTWESEGGEPGRFFGVLTAGAV
ncbi:hypothetical protein [Gemmatimonas sp.]